jgi:hypothetical protein
MPGRPIRRDTFARGMVFSAALIGALGGSLVLSLGAIVAFAVGMAVGAAIAAFACSRWPGLSAPAWTLWPAAVAFNPMVLLGAGYSMANWECVVGKTTGWSCLFTDLGPMLCGLGLVPPSMGLIARWWAARQGDG